MPAYRLYGLTLRSDLEIAALDGVRLADAEADPDVEVSLTAFPDRERLSRSKLAEPWFVSRHEVGDEGPDLEIAQLDGGERWMRWSDGTEFVISADRDSIQARWPDHFELADAVVYLLGPVMGVVLRAHERVALHASVVDTGEGAIAFVGPGGAGKSTIAAMFAASGHSVLSDDLLVLAEDNGGFHAEPGYPRVLLWPESVERLYGDPGTLPPLVKNWDKRFLDLTATGAFCGERRPLIAVYLLEPRVERGPAVTEHIGTGAAEQLVGLAVNAYGSALPAAGAGSELETLARLTERIPIRQIGLGSAPASSDEVVDELLASARGIKQGTVG